MNTAYVLFDSWAGRTKARVTILKACAKRSKVRFEEKAFWRPVGHVQYVPNSAIERPCATCMDDQEVCATIPGLRHCEAANRCDD